MLIPPEAWTALLDAGLTVRPVGPSEVELGTADGRSTPVTAAVERRVAPLSPSHVRQHVNAAGARTTPGDLLLIVPAASPAALDAAASAGISVLVADESRHEPVVGRIVLPTATVVIGADRSPAAVEEPPLRAGPRPWGALAVVRQLLAGALTSQVDLATRAGVSQGRVSQTLSGLVEAGLVKRASDQGRSRWVTTNWDALADWWLKNYPGPGGLTTYWYGLAPAVEQARTVVSTLTAAQVPVAVSGDVAADVLAAWRHPHRAVVYADISARTAVADLTSVGLTPSGPEEATLELVVPADHGVWAAKDDPAPMSGIPLADAMQVLWDLRRAPGSDVDQAIAALRPVLRARAAVASTRDR